MASDTRKFTQIAPLPGIRRLSEISFPLIRREKEKANGFAFLSHCYRREHCSEMGVFPARIAYRQNASNVAKPPQTANFRLQQAIRPNLFTFAPGDRSGLSSLWFPLLGPHPNSSISLTRWRPACIRTLFRGSTISFRQRRLSISRNNVLRKYTSPQQTNLLSAAGE